MDQPKVAPMNMAEYDAFVAMVNAFTDEQKQTALRLLPDDMIWFELSARYNENKQKLDNILNAARA